MGKSSHKVSVIIPTTKKERIQALLADSNYSNFEWVIVCEGLERSAQRNIGIMRATGEYLLFLDSDQSPSPDLIGECVKLMEVGFSAVYIPEVIKTKGLFAYIRNWERQFYNGTPIDCVRFVRAKNCPTFDPTLNGPEDSDWDRRVPGIRAISKNCLYHYDNIGIKKYFAKKAYYAKSMCKFAQKNKDDKVLNFWWRCFGVFLENGKWRRFLRRPDLALCVLGIIFMRGIIYLWKK